MKLTELLKKISKYEKVSIYMYETYGRKEIYSGKNRKKLKSVSIGRK